MRDAFCHVCGTGLKRTAASLVKTLRIRPGAPLRYVDAVRLRARRAEDKRKVRARRTRRGHVCAVDNQGTCHTCGKLMNEEWRDAYEGAR